MKKKLLKKLKLVLVSALGISNANSQVVTTFAYTGGMQTYTVPSGVTSITLDVKGAQGGFGYNAPSSPPGSGGRVQGVLAVTPGEVLNIYVGGKGVDGTATVGGPGGYNGGGLGGTWSGGRCGGGGGGASDVRQGGNALANRVVVGSGGGGTGVNYSTGNSGGNGGGLNGVNGLTGSYLGAGATQFAGGSPNGALGVGGPGGVGQTGGGGGGGYYGGGGSAWEGGGGGSSYTAPSGVTSVVHTTGFQTGNGEIVVTASSPGAALNFDGTNDIVNIGTNLTNAIGTSSVLTVEAWVRPTTLVGTAGIVSNHNNNSSFALRRIGNYFESFIGFGTHQATTTANSATLNVWQHVAMVFNSTSLRMYINGNLAGTTTFAPFTLPSNSIGNAICQIGSNGFGEHFGGDVDEVRVWKRALCQGEIQNNMMAQIPTTGNQLLANYHFNQGQAAQNNSTVTTLTDASGSNFNGTLANMALTGATSNWVSPGGVASGSSVTAFVSPTIAVSGVNSICSGSSATLTASGASTYSWTSGPNTAAYAVTPSVTTTYSVIGTAVNGCVTSLATKGLTVNPTPTVAVSNNSVCGSGLTSLTVTATGGSPFTYVWSTGATTSVISNAVPGVYTSTVTNANGCFASSSGTITSSPNPTVTVNSGAVCSGNAFTITPSGANTYTIQGGSAVVSPTANASYTVMGTSAAGCISANTATSNVTISSNPTITVNSGAVCSGSSFTITPSGAATYTYSGGSAVVSPTATSAYTVSGTSTVGCVGNAISNVTVNANPTVTAVSNQTNFICSGQSASLTASGASTYSWSNASTGANISVSPTVTTSYTVTGTSAQGCVANAVVSQSVSACTGIAINVSNKNTEVKLFPNPTNGILNIELGNIENTSLVITNALGQVVLTEKVTNELSSLNIQGLSNGIYFVQVVNNNKVVNTQKIIKQ